MAERREGDGAMGVNAGGRCLRCGTPYEPDDTVCYHCGAPIGETEGDTAPVKVVRVNKSSGDAAAPATSQGEEPGVRTPSEIDLSRITVG